MSLVISYPEPHLHQIVIFYHFPKFNHDAVAEWWLVAMGTL